MKALTFLQMINDNDDYHFAFLTFMESKGYGIIGNQYYKGVAKFYSQPFKPELITELFEGWEFVIVKGYTDYEQDVQYELYEYEHSHIGYIRITKLKDCDCERITILSDIIEVTIPYPDTLERFISNCQQAGIELTWRTK